MTKIERTSRDSLSHSSNSLSHSSHSPHFLSPIIATSMTIMFNSLGHNSSNIFGLK